MDNLSNSNICEEGMKYVMNTYSRFPIALVKGEGIKAWDADGNEYLDFVGGLAVTSLGHCHPKVTTAIKNQAEELVHCSNLYWIEPQVKLAKILAQNSIFDKTFFCNSGAEANETAIKIARKHGKINHGEECYTIISFDKSFHGRTMATLAATAQEKVQKGFHPLPQGFKYSPFNDLDSFEKNLTNDVCAVILEPVQGEGGVNVASKEFLQKVKELCSERNVLLIFDEVQCGMGRTGELFCYQKYGVEPDVITLAKALAGGTAIGAVLATNSAAENFSPGDHASTFGGNPLACAAGIAAIEAILEENLLENTKKVGSYLLKMLQKKAQEYSCIKDVRGMGLLIGLELEIEAARVIKECMSRGLLLSAAGSYVLRFLPPLNTTFEEVDEALNIFSSSLEAALNQNG